MINAPAAAPPKESIDWQHLASAAARRFGTPCYVVRWSPIKEMADSIDTRFANTRARVRSWLSFKTHPVPHIALEWIKSGGGVEVVSEYEFVTLRQLGCPTDQLLVNGVAKHAWLGRYSVPGLRVHFDSVAETERLLPQAIAQQWRVGIRCHVPAERDGVDSIFGGQFGLVADEVCATSRLIWAGGLAIDGVHFHLGHGARRPGAYRESVEYIAALCSRARLTPKYIDCGGGAGAPDGSDVLSDFEGAVRWVDARLELDEIWAEHGRYVTQKSTALVVAVLDVKSRSEGRYLICDGGRTNQALAADGGLHSILTSPSRGGPTVLTTIVGPTCMMDDRLGRASLADSVAPGDLVVWLDAGAYHLPWESRFSQGLCAVVWCDAEDRMTLARDRETPEQWGYLWKRPS